MKLLKSTQPIILLILLCFLSRIPILISPDLRLDSDECLVGLMAKHLYQGKDFSLYFWGQQYGMTIIEELYIIPFYIILGINALAVKLGMLCLWTTGVVFFYKAICNIRLNQNREAFFITTLLIAAPSWALWCMKARGGYLPAFTFSSIALYLVYHPYLNRKYLTYLFMGLVLFVIYESQKFWYTGLIPLILYKMVKDKSYLRYLITAGVYLVINIFANSYKTKLNVAYEVYPLELTKDNIMQQIDRIPEFLYTHMHGAYHFSWAAKPSFFSASVALIFSALVFILLAVAITMLVKREKSSWQFILSVLFIPATFYYSMLSDETQYRYMLPVTGYALISLYLLMEKFPMNSYFKTSTVVVMLVGFIGIGTFWKSHFLRSDREKLKQAIQYFQANDINYVYCADYTFQWDIMFLTNEKILARFFKEPGRRPEFDFAVDKALAAGKKTAVFGNADRRFGEKYDHYEMDDVYYISVNPTKETLQPLFEFREIPAGYK